MAETAAKITDHRPRRAAEAIVPSEGAPQLRTVQPAPALAPARRAKFRARHGVLLASFLAVVMLPMLVAGWYLWTRALDQYASHMAFSVRSAEPSPAMGLLGGIGELAGAGSSDAEILYEFIQSEDMLRAVRRDLDLEEIWSRPGDPVFTLPEDHRIEALQRYWQRMVKVSIDSGSGLIQVRVNAFDPGDAQAIATRIYDESSRTINELTSIAQEDTTRYAREELDAAAERLKEARATLTAFRNRTQIVDPQADATGRAGLLSTLQTQLATALIDLDLIRSSASAGDLRIAQAERRVEVIEERIRQERAQVSGTSGEEDGYSALVGEFEALSVDRQFAEQSYLTAFTAYEAAVAEARRKSRYLAAHISPTRAETPLYPKRFMLLCLLGAITFIVWALLAMTFYALRDRR